MYFTKCILLFYYIQCISKEGGRDKDGRGDKDGIVVVVMVGDIVGGDSWWGLHYDFGGFD